MQYISKWEATQFVIYRHKACGRTWRREITDGSVTMDERGRELPERRQWKSAPQIDNRAAMSDMPWLLCECGMWVHGERVLGKCSGKIKVCNGKCMNAVGPSCDCPCKGEMHGSKHGVEVAA